MGRSLLHEAETYRNIVSAFVPPLCVFCAGAHTLPRSPLSRAPGSLVLYIIMQGKRASASGLVETSASAELAQSDGDPLGGDLGEDAGPARLDGDES